MAQGITARHAHEVRLGLVMYGGVSLAIYINGVAHELFRAVRGRSVYRLLKELTDSDVAVDVVSGASAGGVNGVLLAFALANEREFGTTAALWREHGDIGGLLRDPDGEGHRSLFDSETVYQRALEQGFSRLWRTPVEGKDEDPSPLRELDLFVTGTDYNGEITTTLDAASRAIDVKDHRALFWLKHRSGRKEQLRPDVDAAGRPASGSPAAVPEGITALALLARLTSCFPAAFAPVVVPEAAANDSLSMKKLRLWGRLPEDRPHCFLDGGILDNKPFTTTLRTIFYRTAERPVRRHLFYVEPDPERFQAERAPRFKVPNAVESALDSLTKLPAYESIADDLRLLAEHNEKIDRMARLRARIIETGAKPSAEQRDLWRQARLASLRDGFLRSMLGFERGERLSAEIAGRSALLRDAFDRLYLGGVAPADALLVDFDVDLRLRRLMFLSYQVESPATLHALNRAIELAEILRHALDELFQLIAEARGNTPPEEVWKIARRRATWLFATDPEARPFARAHPERDPGRPLSDEELERTRVELARRLSVAREDTPPESTSVLLLLDGFVEAITREAGPAVQATHDAYDAHDVWLFPLEHVSGAHEWDMIRVTRVSPVDAQRGICQRDLADKVSGDALAHFGAFFKRSWRSNDILWGRLDGACQLIETLAEPTWLAHTLAASASRSAIFGCDRESVSSGKHRERVREWLERTGSLPRAGRRLRAAIADRLARLVEVALLDVSDPLRLEALVLERVKEVGEGLVNDLVRAAHLEILDAELPNVVEDAAAEQMTWNQLRTRDGRGPSGKLVEASREVRFDARTLTFTAGKHRIDPLLVTLASRRLAAQALTRLRRRDDPRPLEAYFEHYRVGSETIVDGVPRVVLLELAGRAARVAEECVIEGLPWSERVRASWLYRLFASLPLFVFHRTAEFLQRAPSLTASFVVAAALYFALSLAVNVIWFNALYATDGMKRQVALALFVVLPLVLAALAVLLVRPLAGRRRFSPGRLLGGAGIVGAALYGALFLIGQNPAGHCAELSAASLVRACEPVLSAAPLLIPLVAGLVLGALGSRARARN